MKVTYDELKDSIWSRFREAFIINDTNIAACGINAGRQRYFSYLLENLLFRFRMIFSFEGLGCFGGTLKAILLIVLGLPFIAIELINLVWYAIYSIIPIIEFVVRLMTTLFCGIISTILYALIICPNLAKESIKDEV